MKFVKENLTVLICATVALLLVVAAFVWPIPSWKGDLVKEMTNDLGETQVVSNLMTTTLTLPGLPEKKGIPSNAYIAAKAKAQTDITAQKKSVEDAGRVVNSRNRLSANRQPLLAAPTAANPENMIEEPNLLPKSQGGDALKFKADYMNQFRLWTGWLLKGTPSDMELNASMPPDANDMRAEWDANQQKLQAQRGAAGMLPQDPNAYNNHVRQQVTAKAADIRMYVDQFAFQRRPFASTDNPPTEDEIFYSLVDSWLQSDVVKSIAAINGQANSPGEHSIAKSPVKRLTRIVIGNGARTHFLMPGPTMGQGNSLINPVSDIGPLFLTPGNAVLGLGGQSAIQVATSGDTAAANVTDYTFGMSGRAGGAEYDIVMMDVVLDIDPAKLNTFIDQLYQKNMGYTIAGTQIKAVDPLDRVSNGYLYGDGQVYEVELLVECLFFRSWTVPLMTERIRNELGQPAPKPANP